jgi:hypothetical protein
VYDDPRPPLVYRTENTLARSLEVAATGVAATRTDARSLTIPRVEESEASTINGRSVLAGVLIVLAVAGVVFLVLLVRGGGPSDEEAVRAWFQTPAGGGAPADLTRSIHVGVCLMTGAVSQSKDVLRCTITTDAPTANLGTCFVIVDGKAVRGGWQLAAFDSCNALRFDPRSRDLVDLAGRVHYPLTEQ